MSRSMIVIASTCLICLAGTALAGSLKPVSLGLRTTDCRGQTGYANVEIDRITRLQPYACPEGGPALTQLLARPATTAAGLEVHTLTAEEAARVQTEIERLRVLRERALEQGKTVIIEH